ncbi:MAG: nitroreductase family protein [bacterium]
MNFFEVIKIRRSIRSYQDKPVEKEKLEKILDTAHLAPSAKNIQPWKIILVDDKKLKENLVEATKGQKFLMEAHCVIVACVNEKECYQELGDYTTSFAVDGAIFLDHLILSATALGIGTCWIAKFNEIKIKNILNIPKDYRVIGLTPLGYPAESGKDKGRKSLSEILYKNKWNEDY